MLRSLGAGLRAAMRQPWLALLLWTWSAVVSLAAALPAAVWLSRGLALRPRGDVLLDGFSWEVFKELLHYDASPVPAMLLWAALGAVAIAAAGNAMVNGGLLEVLWSRGEAEDRRPRLHRFFRGAGRFFLVNLRLLVLSSVLATLAIAALLAVLSPLSRALEYTQSEPLAWLDVLLPLAVVALVVAAWGAVLDFARLRVVATDGRGAARACLWALRFVARHPASTLGLWTGPAVLKLALATVGVLLVPYVPVAAWMGIAAVVLLQQATVFARAMLRVATVAAEADYAGSRRVDARDATEPRQVEQRGQPALPFLGEGL